MAIIKDSTPGRAAGPSASNVDDVTQYQDPRDGAGFVFGRSTFIWIGIGVALMALGMLLMAGGSMPSPDVWDDELIYSFRRITLAPIVCIAGLGVVTYAILKK